MLRKGNLLLLLQLIMVVSIQPTDYRKNASSDTPLSTKCQRKTRSCGPFQPPTDDVGQYDCNFNSRQCTYMCSLKCPRSEARGKWVLEDKRSGREIHVCQRGEWKRKDSRTFCKAKYPVQEVSQNLHHTDYLNHLVNDLLNTSYFYLGMSTFYDRADVDLPGFGKFMSELWSDEMEQAKSVLQYVNKRGGYISLYDLPRPSSHEMLMLKLSNKPGLMGMQMALQANREINGKVLMLHRLLTNSAKHNDPHLKSYLEGGLIRIKVDKIKQIVNHITRLQSFSEEDYTLGEYVLDTELRS